MKRILPSCKKKKRIFVFDRDSAFIEALSLFFRGMHDIYGFKSIEEIHSVQDKPDIILLDIFPLISTNELSKKIDTVQKIYHKIPILLTSTSRNTFHKAKKIGIHDFLEKPFDIELLQKKILSLA